MFNLLMALITGVVIGWNFHAFFIQLTPPNILKNDINISQTSQLPEKKTKQEVLVKTKIVEESIAKKEITKKTSNSDSFQTLLEKNLFSDAMSLYLEASSKKLPTYRSTLLRYFKTKAINSPKEAISQMLEFTALTSQDKAINIELIKTYKSIKEYPSAIELISHLIDTLSASELDPLHVELIETSQAYIKELNSSKSFNQLSTFLQERIDLGIKTPFYIYSLANYYVEMEEYDYAIQLLKEIEYDYDYGPKAKNLLAHIQKKLNQDKEYTHQLALKKVGEHFTLDVSLNNVSVTLLLDTGASLTMVNVEKTSSLTVIKENITLNTAGGEINAQLQEADTFSVGDIELENFQVVSSTFEQKNADGLLGMNFFKKFKFKIDQEKGILFLSPKG